MFSKNLDKNGILDKREYALFSEKDRKESQVKRNNTKTTPTIINSTFIFFIAKIRPKTKIPNTIVKNNDCHNFLLTVLSLGITLFSPDMFENGYQFNVIKTPQMQNHICESALPEFPLPP